MIECQYGNNDQYDRSGKKNQEVYAKKRILGENASGVSVFVMPAADLPLDSGEESSYGRASVSVESTVWRSHGRFVGG